jgi:Uma2 family endonuclease
MSAAPKRLLTPEEYLAQERKADFRSEYLRGEVFAMAGGTWGHCLIKDNLAREAGSQLRDTPCRVFTSDLRVKVTSTGLYTYPDLVFVYDEPQFEDETPDTLLNPRVVVEVLSDSTEKYDRGVKFAHYRTIPSFQEYVLVAQDQALVERYVRQPDNSWLLTAFTDIGQVFEFVSVPVRVPLAEVYRKVAFPKEPTRGVGHHSQ